MKAIQLKPGFRVIFLLAGLAGAAALPACVGTLPLHGVKQLEQISEQYRKGDNAGTVTRANAFLTEFGGTEPAGEAYYLRGLAYANMRDRARATADLEQSLRLAKRSDLAPLAHVALGNLAFEQGAYAPAAKHYEQAVEQLPNQTPKDLVLYRLGASHARLGQWQSGKTWFAQLIHLFPGSPVEAQARRYYAADGFSVQCGAFGDYENARKQVDYLRSRGLPARQVLDVTVKYYLVHVGLYRSYAEARAAQAKVSSLVSDPFIVP